MRIIAGKYGGRHLHPPMDNNIRPTADKVRGAIFNALLSRINLENIRVLDLFSGTGALGLEAISRGAAHCTFIDRNQQSLRIGKENAKSLELTEDEYHFLCADAAGLMMNKADPFDLVFLDPPYHKNLILPALDGLHQGNWIKPGVILVAETESDLNIQSHIPPAFKIIGSKKYGAVQISYLQYS